MSVLSSDPYYRTLNINITPSAVDEIVEGTPIAWDGTNSKYAKFAEGLTPVGIALRAVPSTSASPLAIVVQGRVDRTIVEAAFGNTLTEAQIVAFCNNGIVIA